MKHNFYLVCGLMLVGVISTPSVGGLVFSSSKPLPPKMITVTHYLDASNPDLRRALEIHNLLNRMLSLQDVIQNSKDVGEQKDVFEQQMKMMADCHAKKYGDIFGNSSEAWDKMMKAYEDGRLVAPESTQSKIVYTEKDRTQDSKKHLDLSRKIMMDVYQNPSKWGSVKGGAAFPLWEDQKALYDQQWNDYYNKMNVAYGMPVSNRPQIDDSVRYNEQKYDEVLKAHNAYLTSIKTNKKVDFKELPPKAPKGLPDWNELFMVDGATKEVYPELPAIWKDQKARQNILQASPNGELAQLFKNGNPSQPTDLAMMGGQSELEQEYNYRLALDAMQQGSVSVNDTTQSMLDRFNKGLESLGFAPVDLKDKGQYLDTQKMLKSEKQKAIANAKKYIQRLEKQDAEHPELVERRQKLQALKQLHMSDKAQEALKDSKDIIQMNQMSPATQQKLVVLALEKDSDTLVFLTETNAIDVDQMMRERTATNKLIAESQTQMQTALEKQIKDLPKLAECPF